MGSTASCGKRTTKSGRLPSSRVTCSKKSTCSLKPAISKSRRSFTSPQFPRVCPDVVKAVESAVVRVESDSVLSPKSFKWRFMPSYAPIRSFSISLLKRIIFSISSLSGFTKFSTSVFRVSSACSASFFSDFQRSSARRRKSSEFCRATAVATFSISATRIALFP